ncbi:uncharacterized protein LOC107218731 isoform X1 [Neodiprion lecontei]|uniref:Uncharacterized protein LOC107218731 isoform X1 n=1 Tax=Neodiprion lecontei TaxID=441921 RepID=A0ABM3FXU5_NEOLC|nr:uncharacterized protein LOC107218731 isoform X1 [Neodiprion lecontei]
MADTSSSHTTSDYCNECFSDISSENSWLECAVVGQKPCSLHRRSKKNILQKLFNREIRGCLSAHSYASEEKLFMSIPSWRHLSLTHVFPKSALAAGHIVMGLTQCGQFILTYTYNIEVVGYGSSYKYLLHWWSFIPNHVARKVAEVTLFGNYTIHRDLNIVISQWPTERNKLVVHGVCYFLLSIDSMRLQPTDRAYLTITTVPSLQNCKDCLKVAASYEEEDLGSNWDGCMRCSCLLHGLTVHTTYEVISPYPRFRAAVCLKYWNHVVVNTGNFLHVLRVDLYTAKSKFQKNSERNDSVVVDTVPLDASDVEELDESKTECSDSSEEKIGMLDNITVDQFSKCESTIGSPFTDDINRYEEQYCSEMRVNTSSSNQSDCICDIIRPSVNISGKGCECLNGNECKCESNSSTSRSELAISVRDKILQDFCEDMSQELNIGSDLITLVKHPSCSPMSPPQRLPSDHRHLTWSSAMLNPPSDILRTRNSDSSHKLPRTQRPSSPQPSVSQDSSSVSITSLNSPLHTLSISPTSSCSSRLMSSPTTRWFRHLSPRKRANLQSPPPILPPTPPRPRPTHKLTLEAEKAYEFTDEAHETCEKLSSFRKRRLADKKYEFCDEAEDAENIVPFKHLRDQSKHRTCSIHQLTSPVTSPVLPNTRRRRIDSDHSDVSEFNSIQDITSLSDFQSIETAEKYVLRPLNQNQLSYSAAHRDKTNKICANVSPLVPKVTFQYPTVKCTAHFKRSYIELDDEMVSVITDVEDDETGGYVSYQCVLPMNVHGSGYTQMQMINNSKAEKMPVPHVLVNQLSFDIETFSHHIADWLCTRFGKRYWHCSDYDIEIIDVCALSGDVICLLIMKIEASELSSQSQCYQERKQYEVGCKFTWNIDSNQYRITNVLPLIETKSKLHKRYIWNPTKLMASQMREKMQQPYAHTVRFLQNVMAFAGESITRLHDFDNLVELFITPLPDSPTICIIILRNLLPRHTSLST